MYIGYETEFAVLVDGILRKQTSVYICNGGVEVRLRSYHTDSRKQAEQSANEIINLLHTPAEKKVTKQTPTAKKKPKGKKINGILYLI